MANRGLSSFMALNAASPSLTSATIVKRWPQQACHGLENRRTVICNQDSILDNYQAIRALCLSCLPRKPESYELDARAKSVICVTSAYRRRLKYHLVSAASLITPNPSSCAPYREEPTLGRCKRRLRRCGHDAAMFILYRLGKGDRARIHYPLAFRRSISFRGCIGFGSSSN